jgi:hypothetical protein
MTKLKPGEYSCGCGHVFKPVKFPHTRKCGCGVVITVVKPGV